MFEVENKIIDEAKQGEALVIKSEKPFGKKLYLESYGCQMNFADSEIVAAILSENGYTTTSNPEDSDVILINTCAIRENAEQRIRNRLRDFNAIKKKRPGLTIGILGCMAERVKAKLLEEEKLVDIVAGPDAYRTLPSLISQVEDGHKAVNVLLSREETYADISPVRLDNNGISAYVTIMRGCDNMCSFCVVPFTRGRERSRDAFSIENEARDLFNRGYREVTLLGQNVDSYKWADEQGNVVSFARLLEIVALIHPDLRVRFSTSHPKDMNDEVLYVMAKYENICKSIHLPVQSGSSEILEKMNRGYSREWYLNRIDAIRRIIPECGISTDVMTGFCSETEEQHKETMSLMEAVKYDFSYMFIYSERPKTLAQRKLVDDVPEEVKSKRLAEIIELQHCHSYENNKRAIGKTQRVLIAGVSKKSADRLYGRNTQNTVVAFPAKNYKPGEYANVLITDCTSATLLGESVD